MGAKQLLWTIAIVFVVACFFSGAWLGRTLSSMPPIATTPGAPAERLDQSRLREKDREMAIATAIGSPVAILILFLTGLVVSGISTRGEATATPRTNSNPGQRETG